MDVAALILTALAVVIFFLHPQRVGADTARFGLALLGLALICQFMRMTGVLIFAR